MNKLNALFTGLLVIATACSTRQNNTSGNLTGYVNPFLGTETLWDSKDLGYEPTRRAWGAEVYPGASLPNALVQVSPVTLFGSGSGYQYEDTVIFGFTHTNKGHWNLCHVPILPVTGDFSANNYYSGYTHQNESAAPGYYQVFLERYGINAEMTSTLRSAFHRYTFRKDDEKKLLADLTRSNERVREWEIEQVEEYAFQGFQQTGEKLHFYAISNHPIENITFEKGENNEISIVSFENTKEKLPLELKIGFSFVSIENAKKNLEAEINTKTFAQICQEATDTWENLLGRIQVKGGTETDKETFYSCLYRAFLWPALRSDANGDFVDVNREVVNKGFHYYTDPSFWDDYRNKLALLGIISPEVTIDVINSIVDKGEKRGFMPTFFHGDHASVFVTGAYLRGLRGFNVESAYNLMMRNAMIESRSRPHLAEYIEKGYISEMDLAEPRLETVAKAAVTKTLEYAYDDYAVALLAKELGDKEGYNQLMKRTSNYKNLFDPETGLMRGRLENGEWIQNFDPEIPYYEYLYREANAWQSSFFAPHDPEGLVGLYESKEAFENKLDSLFTIPWKGYEAHNLTVFIGQYCHGNQPDHNFPHMYYFVDKQEKAQHIIDICLNDFYRMGENGLAYCGMDDAGEMSSWYVFHAMGLYTFSPADPEYMVTVPLFNEIRLTLENNVTCTITKQGKGQKITDITYDGRKVNGYFISHDELKRGKELVITTK